MGEIRRYMTMFVVFSALVTGGVLFYNDWASHYGKNLQNLAGFDFVNTIVNSTVKLEEGLKNSQITGTPADLPLIIVTGVYNLLKLLLETLTGVADGLIQGLVVYLHIPYWFAAVLTALLALGLVITIISAITRWDL